MPTSAGLERIVLLLLPGGGGHVDLDARGCAQALRGNSLVRSIPHFNALGFVTALVDAPADHRGEDGLGGFRGAREHAEDLARIIADLRARDRSPVWIVATSRGAISAVNAAATFNGSNGPDGVVLTSALMVGQAGARKAWVAQSVFDHRLEAIRVPLLIVGHAADSCIRSPASAMERVLARSNGVREQMVTITGGPGAPASSGIEACEGRTPHGFVEQEAEVAQGIARFVRGGRF